MSLVVRPSRAIKLQTGLKSGPFLLARLLRSLQLPFDRAVKVAAFRIGCGEGVKGLVIAPLSELAGAGRVIEGELAVPERRV